MSKLIFLFDLDATITKQQLIPFCCKKIGIDEKLMFSDNITSNGEFPFKESFLKKVSVINEYKASEVRNAMSSVPLNENLVNFIQNNKERCYIVTNHLEVWVKGILERIGLEKNVYCSKSVVKEDRIQDVVSIVDKNIVCKQILLPYVAVGNGDTDADMISSAEVGIGYGGVMQIAPSILACATHVIYDEGKLVDFLELLS